MAKLIGATVGTRPSSPNKLLNCPFCARSIDNKKRVKTRERGGRNWGGGRDRDNDQRRESQPKETVNEATKEGRNDDLAFSNNKITM